MNTFTECVPLSLNFARNVNVNVFVMASLTENEPKQPSLLETGAKLSSSFLYSSDSKIVSLLANSIYPKQYPWEAYFLDRTVSDHPYRLLYDPFDWLFLRS